MKMPSMPWRAYAFSRAAMASGGMSFAAPSALEEPPPAGARVEVHPGRGGGVGEPAQHAEERARRSARAGQERAQHHRHVGGHGRKDVLQRGQRHEHRRRPATLGKPRHPVEERGSSHRASASARAGRATGRAARRRAPSRSRRCGRWSRAAGAPRRHISRTSAASRAVADRGQLGHQEAAVAREAAALRRGGTTTSSACARATVSRSGSAAVSSPACRSGAAPRGRAAGARRRRAAGPRAPRRQGSRARRSGRARSREGPGYSWSVPAQGDASVTTGCGPRRRRATARRAAVCPRAARPRGKALLENGIPQQRPRHPARIGAPRTAAAGRPAWRRRRGRARRIGRQDAGEAGSGNRRRAARRVDGGRAGARPRARRVARAVPRGKYGTSVGSSTMTQRAASPPPHGPAGHPPQSRRRPQPQRARPPRLRP